MKVYSSILELIGNTPIVKLRKEDETIADIFVKLEYMNPGGSVKDRIALKIIEELEQAGKIKKGDTLIEATSGNTGIGAAMIAAYKGYKLLIVMPDSMSNERKNLLKAYGAELILTPAKEGMKGAVNKANELVEKYGYFPLQQFENKENPKAHIEHTAQEILEVFDKKISAFVAGVGTGGTITGVGQVLRANIPDILIVAVEPKDSPVLSGGKANPHKIQGIGAGFVPPILDTKIYHEIIQVTTEEAYSTARKLAKTEGILAGISTGANVFAAKIIAKRLGKGHTVITIAPSNGERYLSTDLYS